MELSLINKELCEARLYTQSRRFGKLSGRDIADLFYLHTLCVLMMNNIPGKKNQAQKYAAQTADAGPYAVFRTNATDLNILGYMINVPNNTHADYDSSTENFLESLNFDNRLHYQFMKNIAKGNITASTASTYLFRLETQLRIKNSDFKNLRRRILDWKKQNSAQKYNVVTRLKMYLQQIAPYGEMFTEIKTIGKPSVFNKLIGAAIGAVAGRAAASKAADIVGSDVEKSKKLGTGLGAIAGYWAAGRRQVQ